MMRTLDDSAAAERRIERLIAVLGALGALIAALISGWRWGAGILAGAVLSWINFRWIAAGTGALAQLATQQEDAAPVRIPTRVYVKFLGSFALMLAAVYVILSRSLVPGISVVIGLCSVVAAVFGEVIYELASSSKG